MMSSLFATGTTLLLTLTTFQAIHTISPDEVFKDEPGTVTALEDGPVILNWTTSLSRRHMHSCHWEYFRCRDCSNQGDDFLGFNAEKGGRQNLTSRHHGWMFQNTKSPCEGGIYRNNTRMEDSGYYLKRITTAEPELDFFYSDFSKLQVYKEVDLDVEIRVNNSSTSINLADRKLTLIKLNPINVKGNTPANVTATLSDNFPVSGNIDIVKRNSKGISFTIPKCCGSGKKACQLKVTVEGEKNVSITFFVDTGIQGHPYIVIYQPFIYDAVINEAATSESTSNNLVIWVSVLVIIAVVVSICAVVYYNHKQNTQRKWPYMCTRIQCLKPSENDPNPVDDRPDNQENAVFLKTDSKEHPNEPFRPRSEPGNEDELCEATFRALEGLHVVASQ